MVKRTTKSALAGKLGEALRSHAQDETDYGKEFIDLPPGISNGVAQLIDAKIGTYKDNTRYAGEQFLYLAGSVVEPTHHTFVGKVFQDGKVENLAPRTITVEGQRTSLMVPLCETTNASGETTTLDENVERGLNELRKLGVDTSSIETEEDLVDLLDSAKETVIHFRFGTSARDPNADYPEQRVWENWYGAQGLEDYESQGGGEVIDETEEKVDDEMEAEEEEDSTETVEEEGEEEKESEAEDILEGDGETADKENSLGNREAQVRLTASAKALGIDPDKHETWSEIEQLIREEEGEGEGEEEEKLPPEKGDVFLFKPPKKRKAIKCEITAVFPNKKTCNLRSLVDKISYKGIAWDKLVEVETSDEG